MKKLILFLIFLIPALARAQSYTIDWYKVAGGGGTSTGTNAGTVYSLSGTTGQQDASTAMSGGQYSLTGGFWSLIALVQSAGAPTLSIAQSGNSAIISWSYPSTGFFLQTNSNLDKTNWSNYTGTIVTNVAGGSNTVTITPPVGNLYFRLGP
jgi:hypothetical protein